MKELIVVSEDTEVEVDATVVNSDITAVETTDSIYWSFWSISIAFLVTSSHPDTY
jgi:hypothetical protein